MVLDPHCLTEEQMNLKIPGLNTILIGRVVPILILFGISGNILNLTVLLAKNMRTRSNVLLACLAVADVIFLIGMIPDAMVSYFSFTFYGSFAKIYLWNNGYKLHLLNWSSASAIWLILIICLERLMGIRYPLSVRKHKGLLTPLYLVSFVVVITGILTFYNQMSYHFESKVFCNGTQHHASLIYVDSDHWIRSGPNPMPQWRRLYVRWNPQVNAVFVVFLPLLFVGISNVLLIITMRQRQRFFTLSNNSSEQSTVQMRTEQKVTLTVCAIVTCFTITQGPSAVIPVVSSLWRIPLKKFALENSIITTMVVLGKTMNFILFCLSSATFRKRLFFRTKQSLMLRKTTTHRKSSWTNTTRLESVAPSPKTSLINNNQGNQGNRTRAASLKLTAQSITAEQNRDRNFSVSAL